MWIEWEIEIETAKTNELGYSIKTRLEGIDDGLCRAFRIFYSCIFLFFLYFIFDSSSVNIVWFDFEFNCMQWLNDEKFTLLGAPTKGKRSNMFIHHIIISVMLNVKLFADCNRRDTLALFLDRHWLSRNDLIGVKSRNVQIKRE